jgi:hypothetical protein
MKEAEREEYGYKLERGLPVSGWEVRRPGTAIKIHTDVICVQKLSVRVWKGKD